MDSSAQARQYSSTYVLSGLISAFVSLICFSAIYIFTHTSTERTTLDKSQCVEIGADLICFFPRNVSENDLVAILSSFYNNIFVALIAILTIVAAIAAITIRTSAKAHVESELPELTENFFKLNAGRGILDKIIQIEIDPKLTDLAKIKTDVANDRETLYAVIAKLEELQAFLDEADLGVTVTIANGNNGGNEDNDEAAPANSSRGEQ